MSREDVKAYYAHFGEREWERLAQLPVGTIEYDVTRHFLEIHIAQGSRVLDLGGGPGRYTIWLAERDCRVVLADVSPVMLDLAREKISTAGVEANVEAILEMDACDLGAFEDEAFDAVLALGPFYHLVEEGDRERAAQEVVRVLKPGGAAFVALMPRLIFLRRTIAVPDERHRLKDEGWLTRLMEKGVFINDVEGRFSGGYGVIPEEVGSFFEGHGLREISLVATEGISAGIEEIIMELREEDPVMYVKVLQLLIATAEDPSILGMCSHLLYIGRKDGSSD
jgi:SAM-dependent methyltransferase